MGFNEWVSFIADELSSAGNRITDFMDGAITSVYDFLCRLGERLSTVNPEVITEKAASLRSIGIVSIVLIVIGVLFAIRLLSKPVRIVLKLLVNTFLGFALLFTINFFGGRYGVGVELTWFNAIITGILGIPGLGLLMLLRFIRVAR